MRSPRSGLRPFAPRKSSPLCRMPSPRLRSTLTRRKSFRSRACPNQCSASVTRLASLSIDAGTPRRSERLEPKGTSRSLKIGLWRQTPAARSTTPGRPTQTPAISSIARPASLTHLLTPSSTRSAMTEAVCRSMRMGRTSELKMSAQKLVVATAIWSGASLTPTTWAASGFSFSMTRGRPRPASRTAPTWSGMMRRSSRSVAVIAETVVRLSSVNSEISTRDIGPNRRIASMTWKRLMARISSGSAVFIVPQKPASQHFLREAELISLPLPAVNWRLAAFLRRNGLASLTQSATRETFNLYFGQKAEDYSLEETMSLSRFAFAAALATLAAPAFADTNITVLHVSENKAQVAVWDKAAADYNAQQKGVNVQFKYLENEAFKAKLPTMLQSQDSRPELFYSWAGGVMQAQNRAGFLKDLTADVGSVQSTMVPAAVDAFKASTAAG